MAAVLIPIAVILFAVIAGVIALKRLSSRDGARASQLREIKRETLRYVVPRGQDPAAVVAALQRAGYDAMPDAKGIDPGEILIGGSAGEAPDREAVRRVLADANANMEGQDMPEQPVVRFADE